MRLYECMLHVKPNIAPGISVSTLYATSSNSDVVNIIIILLLAQMQSGNVLTKTIPTIRTNHVRALCCDLMHQLRVMPDAVSVDKLSNCAQSTQRQKREEETAEMRYKHNTLHKQYL